MKKRLALTYVMMCLLLSACAAGGKGSGSHGLGNARSFDSDGVKIAYLEAGQGEPVVLIHGLNASAEMNWVKPGIFDLLAQRYHVVAIDLRGHGNSDKPHDADAYGQPMVEDVVRLMDRLHIDRPQIVGYSMGGMVTMRLAITHPERVKAIALGGMGFLRENSDAQRSWETRRVNPMAPAPAAAIHGVAKLAVSEQAVRGVRVPVEILVGDRDDLGGPYVDALRAVRPDWPVVQIRDANHLNCPAKPQFREELLKWLERNQ